MMTDSKPLRFRRKRRCTEISRSILPVPVGVHSSEWPVYKGQLVGKTVLITNLDHAHALQQGFFGTSNQHRRRQKNVAVETSDTQQKKEDEAPVESILRLSLEEAFFLSFGLGCLHVYENDKVLNLEELNSRCEQLDSLFHQRYVVYHYYRSKGWVVKSGIKFGVDYILYKEGPPFYHASCSVLMVTEADESQNRLTWTSLAGLNRLSERVAKALVLCYVSESEQPVTSQLLSDRIFRFQIQEQLIDRWISTDNREGKETAT